MSSAAAGLARRLLLSLVSLPCTVEYACPVMQVQHTEIVPAEQGGLACNSSGGVFLGEIHLPPSFFGTLPTLVGCQTNVTRQLPDLSAMQHVSLSDYLDAQTAACRVISLVGNQAGACGPRDPC